MTYIETPSALSSETGSTTEELISKPGDVVVDALYITKGGVNYNIKNFSPKFVLYEDIFSNFLSGEVYIADAGELISKLNLNGTEFITLSFRTPQSSASIEKSFIIYALKDRLMTSTNREEIYTLLFTSPENVINNTKTISKKFTGKTHELVKKIFLDELKYPRFVDGDKTKNTTQLLIGDTPHKSDVTLVSPYWSPIHIINWIAARSVGKESKAPTMLFFESNRSFVFTSFENLITSQIKGKSVIASYIYSPTSKINFDLSSTSFTINNIARQHSLVTSIAPFDYFDIFQGQNTGLYANFLYTHDILLKEFRQFSYNHLYGYEDYYFMEDYETSNNNPVLTKKKNTRPFSKDTLSSDRSLVQFRTKQYKMFDEVVDPQYQSWVPQRTSLMMQMNNFKLHITVPGRSDLEVGRLIYFVYPQAHSGDDKEFVSDKKVSGIYMITAIQHIVTQSSSYECVLEITKDSFFEGLL